jgi:hypothetical protein
MIFIKGNFPSFKNSKQFTGKYFIMSKTVQKYLKGFEYQWEIIPKEFLDLNESNFPVKVGFHFVRGTKHRWDFHNMLQGCADLMVKHKWIPDDNMDYFIPSCLKMENKFYSYSKETPGVYIQILD